MIYFFLFLLNVAFANPDSVSQHQNISIYVDITEVIAQGGKTGTSAPLNVLVSHHAQVKSQLVWSMNRHSSPNSWEGEISIYDWTNIAHMPGFKQCNYNDAVKCGIINNHWTLRTVVSVGDKYSIFSQKLYDEKGKIVGKSYQTAWGKIMWKPKWKLTRVKDQTAFGGASREIFEMWPPEIEELPPLIRPLHVMQSRMGVYTVEKSACRSRPCVCRFPVDMQLPQCKEKKSDR